MLINALLTFRFQKKKLHLGCNHHLPRPGIVYEQSGRRSLYGFNSALGQISFSLFLFFSGIE